MRTLLGRSATTSAFLVTAVSASLLLGCQSRVTVARETFSKSKSCPLDRVTARERPDLSAYDVIFGKRATPPPEVAKDPARLALWQKQQDESRRAWDAAQSVVEVEGCGERALAMCSSRKRTSCSLR